MTTREAPHMMAIAGDLQHHEVAVESAELLPQGRQHLVNLVGSTRRDGTPHTGRAVG